MLSSSVPRPPLAAWLGPPPAMVAVGSHMSTVLGCTGLGLCVVTTFVPRGGSRTSLGPICILGLVEPIIVESPGGRRGRGPGERVPRGPLVLISRREGWDPVPPSAPSTEEVGVPGGRGWGLGWGWAGQSVQGGEADVEGPHEAGLGHSAWGEISG